MASWKVALSTPPGVSRTDLHVTLARVSAELATTKVWIWDAIRTSDERYDGVSATL
jgi:hypothetical protein